MKKLAVLSLLAFGMMFFSGAAVTPAHAVCIHLGNFCDVVQLANDANESEHMYGEWDWQCTGVGSNIYGRNASKKITVGTRPVDPFYGYPFPYTVDFVFNKQTLLFDLPATDGHSTFLFQAGSPWSSSPGNCGLSNTPHKNVSGRPSAVGK